MNREKWERATAHRLVVKLSEEIGEVSCAYLNAVESRSDGGREHWKRQMISELDHVIMVSEILSDKIGDAPRGFLNDTPDDDNTGVNINGA